MRVSSPEDVCAFPRGDLTLGTPLAGTGKIGGTIRWDPSATVPEGGIR